MSRDRPRRHATFAGPSPFGTVIPERSFGAVRIYVGTSGFAYKEWKGPFYPEKLPDSQMLRYYTEQLGAVEINNTFYRMPRTSMLEGWAQTAPSGFRFVLKGSRRITHQGRLQEVGDSVQYLFDQATHLGDKLGAVLFQLPPSMKKDVPRLRAFLDTIPEGRRVAMEFRHASWHDDAVYETLRERDAALCIAEHEDPSKSTPLVSTASWGYIRLRAAEYTEGALQSWARHIREHGWNEGYVFFKHEDEGAAPQLALRLVEILKEGSR